MSQTIVRGFGEDPRAQKKWGTTLYLAITAKAYWNKFSGTTTNSIIQTNTDLEQGAGDRISYDLSIALKGSPTRGDDTLDGKAEGLRFATDEIIIDQIRHAVSAGGNMTRKRTAHNMRKLAKDRLADYWAKYLDELRFIYLSGARGVNEDYIEPTSFTGHAKNTLDAPSHIVYPGTTSKSTITASDKMSKAVIERAIVKGKTVSQRNGKANNLQPISIGSSKHFVMVMSEWQAYDLRTADTTGWMDIQKAAINAEGRSNPIFQGGLGMINNTVLHEHASVVRFNDYGAGTVQAARALLLGAQAGSEAYGSSNKDRFTWVEEMKDYGNEPTVAAGFIYGIKKTRFQGNDFGVVAVDTAAADPN